MKFRSICTFILLLALVVFAGCSHLHVDLDSNWQLSQNAQLVIQVEEPPAEVSVSQIFGLISGLGWTISADDSTADARLECQWQRAIDLTEDSEPIMTVKSFHAKIIAIESGRVLGVADYFYATGESELWPGVDQALTTLHQRLVARPVVAEPVAVAAEPVAVAAEPVAVAVEPVAVAIEPVAVVAEPVAVAAEPVAVAAEPVAVAAEPVAVAAEPVAVVAEPVAVAVEPVAVATEPVAVAVGAEVESPSSAIIRRSNQNSAVTEDPDGVNVTTSERAESVEVSPWIPRFQGMGLENWGKEE